MALDFNMFMANMQRMGFMDWIFPWLLFLILLYVLLIKAPFWPPGKESKMSVVVAAILSFFIINYTPLGMSFGLYLQILFGHAAIFIIGFLVIIMFVALGGFQLDQIVGGNSTVLAIILAVVGVLVFYSIGAPGLPHLSDDIWTLIFVLVIMGGAVMFLGSDSAAGKGGVTH